MSRNQQIINLAKDTYEVLTIDPVFNLSATVDSGLPLFYESQNNNIVNVAQNGDILIIGDGKTTIKIYNLGNIEWEPVEKYVLISVKKKKQSINFFIISDRYISEPGFSLQSYAFSTSGLPIKFKSLTPNIAEINDGGDVLMYNVGTVSFEAVQEGNFEWEAVRVIKDFGISNKHYPFDLELTSRKPNTLIKFNLYQNKSGTFNSVENISGGLYFGDTKYPLLTNLSLNTGEYIGVLNYEFIPSGSGEFILNSFYTFSTGIFSGTKRDKYISFSMNRSGFLDYGMDVIVHGVFTESDGFKYSSKPVLESGIFWSGSFPPKEENLIFTLPLFYNNKIESNIEGQLKFGFINKSGIPESLMQMGLFEEAGFLVSTGNDISATVGGTGILPYYPKDLGADFVYLESLASLDPDKYPQ
jgi:hypothetical protein